MRVPRYPGIFLDVHVTLAVLDRDQTIQTCPLNMESRGGTAQAVLVARPAMTRPTIGFLKFVDSLMWNPSFGTAQVVVPGPMLMIQGMFGTPLVSTQ